MFACLSVRLSVWRFAAQFILTKDCVSVTFRGVVLSAHFQLPLDVVFVDAAAAGAGAAATAWLYFVLFFISTQIVLFAAEHLAQSPGRLALL